MVRSTLSRTLHSIAPVLSSPFIACKLFTCSATIPWRIKELLHQLNIECVFYSDKGLYDALNHAVKSISSPYHMFVHDDDILAPSAGSLLSPRFLNELKGSCVNAYYFDNNILFSDHSSGSFLGSSILRRLFHHYKLNLSLIPEMPFNHVGLLIRTSFSRAHPYRIDIGPSADFAFILELTSDIRHVKGSPYAIAGFSSSDSQLSSRSSFRKKIFLLRADMVAILSADISVIRKVYILIVCFLLGISRAVR